MVAAASCSGGDSSSSEGGTNDTVGTGDQVTTDEGSVQAATGGEPINGVVFSLLSPELGLYAIDRETDEVRELTMDGVKFTDRQTQPILVSDATYTLTATRIEGQFSSHEVGLGKIDLATGTGTEIALIGTDRENDEDQDLITFELVGGAGTTIWVTSEPFSGDTVVSYRSFESTSGEPLAEFSPVPYDVTTPAGSTCTGEVRDPIVLSDGTLVGLMSAWPASIDPTSGEVEPLIEWCDFDDQIDLNSLIAVDEINDYAVTEDGSPIPAEEAENVLGVIEPNVSNGAYIDGDGSLWWIFSTNTGYSKDDEVASAHIGGIVEFDLASNTIVNVWPLAGDTVTYTPGDGADDISSVSSITQADLRILDGKLWIMDWRDDAPLRVLDPATGELASIEIPKGDEYDFISATLISSDPESIWLDVTRSTITSEDDESRSSIGLGFIDQLDIATLTFTSSIDQSSIIGF
jgi:hypothetical protein